MALASASGRKSVSASSVICSISAGSHTSDLRTDYGPVVMTSGGQKVMTGMTKVGCFLGDHTKTGINALLNWFIQFFNQTLHLTTQDKALVVPVTQIVVALVTVAATFPSARISDRIGRKPVIYAACLLGGVGLFIAAIAPSIPVFLICGVILGAGAGTFLAVDWALMTDIIPRAASGRYMGISNIAVAAAGTLAGLLVGPLIDRVGGIDQLPTGPRVAFAAGVAFFVFSAILLRRVDPRPRAQRLAAEPASTR